MNKKLKGRQQNPLSVALRFILENKIATKSQLRGKYNLDPKTLLKIEAGETLCYEVTKMGYYKTFFGIIDDYRWRFPEEDERHAIAKQKLLDMSLILMGRPTDAERRKEMFMRQFRCGK